MSTDAIAKTLYAVWDTEDDSSGIIGLFTDSVEAHAHCMYQSKIQCRSMTVVEYQAKEFKG